MGLGGPNCSVEDLDTECTKLRGSNASFLPFPHKKKIRMDVSPASPLQVPLVLNLQHGPCNISCEGGTINNNCNISYQDFNWQNVSSPFYFDTSNFTSSRFYCVTATIGRCCHVCTKTIFMQDKKPVYFSAHNGNWIFTATTIIAIICTVMALVAFVVKYYMKAYSRHERSNGTPLSTIPPFLDLERRTTNISVICMYIMDQSQPFQDGISDLKSFLRYKGLKTIDMYDEEESIMSSFSHWVERVLENHNTKILLVDSEAIQPLWNGNQHGCRELQLVQRVIVYTGSGIPLTELYNRLFVIRLETVNPSLEEFIYPGSGRVYLFPAQRERLWKDLMSSK
uniref:SEFIR domain-containing protein n=1 Tax=Graphocephala atropunctata TaxID=36148 RepID=A0A1B6KDC0_9HEMI